MDGTLLVGGTSVYISKATYTGQSPLQNAKKRAEAERDVRIAHGEKWSSEKHSEAIDRHRNAYESRVLGDFEHTAHPGAAFHEELGNKAARSATGKKVLKRTAQVAGTAALLGGAAVGGRKAVQRHRAPRGTTNKLESMIPTVPTPSPVVSEVAEAARRLPIKRYALPAIATGATAIGAGALANQLRKADEPYYARQVWYYDRSADAFYEEEIDKGAKADKAFDAALKTYGAAYRNKGKIAGAAAIPAVYLGGRKFARSMAARGVTRESQGLTGAHAADYVAEKLRKNPVGGRIGRAIDRQLARKPGPTELQGKNTLVAAGIAGGAGLGGGLYLSNRHKRSYY
jgi:hypothetical protein